MEMIDVSLFASAVRPKLWGYFLDSLNGTSCRYEVVFAGHCTPEEVKPFLDKYPFFKYVHTAKIKPSQCYEAARRACVGETLVWTADDAENPNDVIGKAFKYWKSQNNEKLILSIQTKESGYGLPIGKLFPMTEHLLKGSGTPLMAPLAMIGRKFLNEIGGFDKQFVCGQYENFVIVMANALGGKVEIFGGPDCYIDIDHLRKSIEIGESNTDKEFLNRPFAKGYRIDRRVLEEKCFNHGAVLKKAEILLSRFEPYSDEDILVKSQGNNLREVWE